MLLYILRRIAILIPVYLGLTLSTFTLIRLVPGDAVEIMMGERMVDPELHARALERLGLDKLSFYDEPIKFNSGNADPHGDPEWIINNGIFADFKGEKS